MSLQPRIHNDDFYDRMKELTILSRKIVDSYDIQELDELRDKLIHLATCMQKEICTRKKENKKCLVNE